MLTARIMTDNTPRRGLKTAFDPEQQVPEAATGGIMQMIFGSSPFVPGPVTTSRSRGRQAIDLDEAGVYDMDTGVTLSPADVKEVRERMARPVGTGLGRSVEVTLDVPPPYEDEPEVPGEPQVARGRVESPTLETVVETVEEEETDDPISDPHEARETVMAEETVIHWTATGSVMQTSEKADTTDPEAPPPAEQAGGKDPESDSSDLFSFSDSDEERPQAEAKQEQDSPAPVEPALDPNSDAFNLQEFLRRQRERRGSVARLTATLAGGGGSGGTGHGRSTGAGAGG
jgi:hypothetical protein